MNVEPFEDTTKLVLGTTCPDFRRDMHVFVTYVREREVKRAHRGNVLPKTDARRLAKLMSDPTADDEIIESGSSQWVDFVDDVALQLGFVEYDTKGVYAGYTSQEPSFPDNFMTFNAKEYSDFLKNTLAQQESRLLEMLLDLFTAHASEFFGRPVLAELDRFSGWGSATGVVPMVDFPQARRFLLKLLAELPTGEWLSTASLIAFLKKQHPYFLIPKTLQFKSKWEQDRGRYDNFHEGDPFKQSRVTVKETDPDAFERVEGRYVERFLEWIPKLFGYVDVAYAKRMPSNQPTLGGLPAFRVSERLRRALTCKIAEPTVKVTPAFEAYVQSEVYPARVLSQLRQISELVSDDTTTVYRLTKQSVAAALAADPKLDAIKRLESLSTTPLPENVRRELADWSTHSEKFVLYTGFSLLETERDVPAPDKSQVECIDPGTYIVRSPDKVFKELEQQERMPLQVTHGDAAFSSLPEGAHSALRVKTRKKAPKPAAKPQVTLMKVTRVQLLCPDRDFLQRLQTVLLGAGCPVEADSKNLSLVYSDRYEAEVGKAIRGLRSDYQVTIENKG